MVEAHHAVLLLVGDLVTDVLEELGHVPLSGAELGELVPVGVAREEGARDLQVVHDVLPQPPVRLRLLIFFGGCRRLQNHCTTARSRGPPIRGIDAIIAVRVRGGIRGMLAVEAAGPVVVAIEAPSPLADAIAGEHPLLRLLRMRWGGRGGEGGDDWRGRGGWLGDGWRGRGDWMGDDWRGRGDWMSDDWRGRGNWIGEGVPTATTTTAAATGHAELTAVHGQAGDRRAGVQAACTTTSCRAGITEHPGWSPAVAEVVRCGHRRDGTGHTTRAVVIVVEVGARGVGWPPCRIQRLHPRRHRLQLRHRRQRLPLLSQHLNPLTELGLVHPAVAHAVELVLLAIDLGERVRQPHRQVRGRLLVIVGREAAVGDALGGADDGGQRVVLDVRDGHLQQHANNAVAQNARGLVSPVLKDVDGGVAVHLRLASGDKELMVFLAEHDEGRGPRMRS